MQVWYIWVHLFCSISDLFRVSLCIYEQQLQSTSWQFSVQDQLKKEDQVLGYILSMLSYIFRVTNYHWLTHNSFSIIHSNSLSLILRWLQVCESLSLEQTLFLRAHCAFLFFIHVMNLWKWICQSSKSIVLTELVSYQFHKASLLNSFFASGKWLVLYVCKCYFYKLPETGEDIWGRIKKREGEGGGGHEVEGVLGLLEHDGSSCHKGRHQSQGHRDRLSPWSTSCL